MSMRQAPERPRGERVSPSRMVHDGTHDIARPVRGAAAVAISDGTHDCTAHDHRCAMPAQHLVMLALRYAEPDGERFAQAPADLVETADERRIEIAAGPCDAGRGNVIDETVAGPIDH